MGNYFNSIYGNDELGILCYENAILSDKFDLKVNSLINSYNMTNFFESTDEDSDIKKEGIVKKIKRLISEFVTKMKGWIDSIFNKGNIKELDSSEYLHSGEGKVRFDKDFESIANKLEDEYLSTKKDIQLISKLTGKDPKDVNNTLNNLKTKAAKGIKYLDEHKSVILTTAVATFSANKMYKLLKGSKKAQEDVDNISKTIDPNDPLATEKLSMLQKYAMKLGEISRSAATVFGQTKKTLDTYNRMDAKHNKKMEKKGRK